MLQYSIWRLVRGPSWARQVLGRTLSLLTRRVLPRLFVLDNFDCSSLTEQALRFFFWVILIVYNMINQVHLGKGCKIEEKVRFWGPLKIFIMIYFSLATVQYFLFIERCHFDTDNSKNYHDNFPVVKFNQFLRQMPWTLNTCIELPLYVQVRIINSVIMDNVTVASGSVIEVDNI